MLLEVPEGVIATAEVARSRSDQGRVLEQTRGHADIVKPLLGAGREQSRRASRCVRATAAPDRPRRVADPGRGNDAGTAERDHRRERECDAAPAPNWPADAGPAGAHT